jgi:hypothetical protein
VDIKHWLAEQFTALDSVRGCTIDRAADIVVAMWGGTIIHVYLLDSPFKTRHLKKLVSDNSRIGIGSLFLVKADLLPGDGVKVEPDEGLLALQALFKDKLYTYRIEKDGPHIGQVHLKSFGRSAEREVWYGPDLHVRSLPCYRVWVTAPNSIKGEWLMANFGSEAFWKHADYTTSRDAFRRQQRQTESQTHSASWSSAGWNRGGSYGYTTPENGAPKQTRTNGSKDPRLTHSYSQLGLDQSATSDEVKAAFRRMARELHPDVSKLPKAEAENRFKTLNEAYTYIKATNGW